MPEYHYKGVDKAGKKVTGMMDAAGEGDLRMLLRAQGVRPVSISKANALNTGFTTLLVREARNVPNEVLVSFTRQLQVLIGSGVPLVQGLEILSEQSTHSGFKSIIIAIREKVSQGTFLGEALGSFPHVFPKLYVALIRAGEASGAMEEMLTRVTSYLEKGERLRRLVKGAMMYPIIVVLIGVGVVSLMLVLVIPKFEDMLKSNGQQLPAPTQIVIRLSHFLSDNLIGIVVISSIFIYCIKRYVTSADGRQVVDRILFKVPLFGDMIQKSGVARFARTMQTLLSAGVNLIDAVDICKATIDNTVLEDAVSKIRSEVETGKTLGAVISKLGVFPRMAVQMISVGESTGNLDKMLEKVSEFYEAEVEALVAGMSKLIEPLVLVVLGGMVGGIMIAMYLPVFQMAGSVQ